MKVVLHDRTNGLGQEVRDVAQRKLTRLARHFGRVAEAEVEFSEERKRSGLATTVCRINLHQIDRQVVAFKEKVTHRKQSVSPVRVPAGEGRRAPRQAQPERLRLKLRPMSEAEARSELDADSQPFVIYLAEDSGEIQILVERPDGSLVVIEPVVP
ncbi:MAG: HPF/RaiA family ribosome-associated protein [Chloroflexi bacterium]|nr:MAG: HPF/RaiA family ribosome-associated protein [Chloroflexota bacterium]